MIENGPRREALNVRIQLEVIRELHDYATGEGERIWKVVEKFIEEGLARERGRGEEREV